MKNHSQRYIIQVFIIIITLCIYALMLLKVKKARLLFIYFIRYHHQESVLDF